ncbi:Uncharacterised protein [Klebsiella quasipneumoniae]|nr:Uncharacterised protein [Klebsiella quasipneumoniae]
MSKHFYDINSLAPIDLFTVYFFELNSISCISSRFCNAFSNKIISFPYSSETRRIAGGVAYRVSNITMTEVILDQTGICTSFRQFVAAGVTQHMRVGLRHGTRLFPGGANNTIRLLA